MRWKTLIVLLLSVSFLLIWGCDWFLGEDAPKPRLSMFIGLDISGSFLKGKYFDDSINFLAHYIYAHLNGLGGLDIPNVLFVSSIGGAQADEPKLSTRYRHLKINRWLRLQRNCARYFPKIFPILTQTIMHFLNRWRSLCAIKIWYFVLFRLS